MWVAQRARRSGPPTLQFLIVLGGLIVALQTVTALYAFFLRPTKAVKTFGAWGLVTGATDGSDKALAMELARKGHLDRMRPVRQHKRLVAEHRAIKLAWRIDTNMGV